MFQCSIAQDGGKMSLEKENETKDNCGIHPEIYHAPH